MHVRPVQRGAHLEELGTRLTWSCAPAALELINASCAACDAATAITYSDAGVAPELNTSIARCVWKAE